MIDELKSPLHRIMFIYNPTEPTRRAFENNISAFHIGRGYFISVAHNLKTSPGFFKSIDEELFRQELLYKMDGAQKVLFDQHYFGDDYTRKYYFNHGEPESLKALVNMFRQKKFDTRWVTLAEKGICEPHVVIQFRDNKFYGSDRFIHLLKPHQYFFEQKLNRYTFILPIELVKPIYTADLAVYKLKDVPEEIVALMPHVKVNTELYDENPADLFCLQSSPLTEAGRLLNRAKIEGILDHFTMLPDDFGGAYMHEGFRYLIEGYFRFGSSGAPYILYDYTTDTYVANAVQSEASGIQLSINHEREGNYQYVNAIASPLFLIRDYLKEIGFD